ncbi:MAG: hypothetical protein EZS28_023489 [Streblomastix strix]|uniref:DM10 domain-containing protein n=1 Tax=Streblomastix strix TaxID=222440 RepID=A0A5J4VEV4_9EUKA|nr:MAG: hypothetical protein EZS28_023489 [Streblomastix strix]
MRVKLDDGDGESYLKTKDLHVGQVYHILGKHLLLYDSEDFTLHYKLGNKRPDQLVQLPMLPGYPTEIDVNRAITEVKTCMREVGVSTEEVAAQCEAPGTPDAISVEQLRVSLMGWGLEPNENTFLGLTSLLDTDMTFTASIQQFIDVMSQP